MGKVLRDGFQVFDSRGLIVAAISDILADLFRSADLEGTASSKVTLMR